MQTVKEIIEYYSLLPHPEGGYYREVYRSETEITAHALPQNFGGNRNCSTAIYFLLEQGNFSAFHRIKSDELWHFYSGKTLLIHVIDAAGVYRQIKLGNNINEGETFMAVVPANAWFASEPAANSEYCLVGCTVSPGFDFADFELAKATELSNLFPQHKALIQRLCRQ